MLDLACNRANGDRDEDTDKRREQYGRKTPAQQITHAICDAQ
jgi:hypothetical protein